jgi:hypothetical protein
MSDATRWQRTKWWARRHEDAIVLGVVGTVCLGIVILGVKAEVSYQAQLTSELNANIDALNALVRAGEILV